VKITQDTENGEKQSTPLNDTNMSNV